MALTYTQVFQEMQRLSQDFSSDLQAEIPMMVDRAERELSKDLNVDAMTVRTTAAFVAGTYIYDKPADTVAIRFISRTPVAGGEITFLEFRRREAIIDYAPNPTLLASRAAPKFWDNYDGALTSQFYVGPTPDVAYPYVIETEVRLNGLAAGTGSTTTWFSNNQPDTIMAACMNQYAKWSKDPIKIKLWGDNYEKNLGLTQSEIARIRSDATSVMRMR